MDLVRWDPFKDLSILRNEFGRLFGSSMGADPNIEMDNWIPAVDVMEDDKTITMKFELPEVDKNDVTITVENDMLMISGERKLEQEENKENYRRIERRYGAFSRSFMLPEIVDRDEIKAESRDGVLRITLAKTKSSKTEPKLVPIS